MKKVMLIFGLLFVSFGIYLTAIIGAPYIPSRQTIEKSGAKDMQKNSVEVASIGLYAPIIEGQEDALNHGAWHRFASRGNPADGGTFILSAHSFVFRWNPMQTRQDSYFFNLHKASVGDTVIIMWSGKQYSYTVTKVYQVRPDAVAIEDSNGQDRLVMYTCTPGGSADGRVVVEAKPN